MRQLKRLVVGPRFARRLTLTHVLDDFAIAFINMSLLGSLFFSVSANASRQRILAYLVLTVLPLGLCAPFLGRILDRATIGARVLIVGSQLTRAVAAIMMIPLRFSVALYPLAFVVLVSKKVYSLTKSALLTQLTDDGDELVRADAHIARSGSLVGSVGTAIGGALAALGLQELLLAFAVPLFLVAAWAASGLRSARRDGQAIQEELERTGAPVAELAPSALVASTWAISAMRAALGALTYLLALAVKRGGNDQWIFATSLLAAGLGAMVATFVSAAIIRRLHPEGTIAAAILVPAIVALAVSGTLGRPAIPLIAFCLGLANSVGGRCITLMQSKVPLIARGRVISKTELLFQITNVVGAAAAVQFNPLPRTGIALTGLLLLVVGTSYAFDRRATILPHEAIHEIAAGRIARAEFEPVPHALLAAARRTASLGGMRSAMLIARHAVSIAERRAPLVDHPRWNAWVELAASADAAADADAAPDLATAMDVLSTAEDLVHSLDVVGHDPHVAHQGE